MREDRVPHSGRTINRILCNALLASFFMNIETRTVGKYVWVKITDGETTYDLGLHDKQEAETLSAELLSASLELQDLAEQLG